MKTGPSSDVGTELLFENDRVRVWQLSLGPGETSPQHRHEADYVYVYLMESRIAVESVGSVPVAAAYDDGYVQYREVGPGVEHRIRNVGPAAHRQIIVELKGPSRSRTPGAPQTNGRKRP